MTSTKKKHRVRCLASIVLGYSVVDVRVVQLRNDLDSAVYRI
jgi:hypothetical protein